MSEEFTSERIGQKEGPTLKFTGRLLDELDQPRHRNRDGRWFGGQLWETAGGAWIADSIHCSDNPGEDDHHRALILKPDMGEQDRQFAVMEHFNWTTQARAMAKRLGWKLVVVVE